MNQNILYRNPFSLIGIEQRIEASIIKPKIQRVKDIILQYTDDVQNVDFRGGRMPKEDALRLMNELSDEHLMNQHFKVLENKHLKRFLEYGHLGYLEVENYTLLEEDEDFLQFIKPYFLNRYNELLWDAIKRKDQELLNQIAAVAIPTSYEYTQVVAEDLKLMLQATQELKDFDRSELSFITEFSIKAKLKKHPIKLFNSLPDHLLEIKEAYIRELLELAVYALQRMGREDLAVLLVKHCQKIEMPTKTKESIDTFASSLKEETWKIPAWLWWGLMVLSLLYLLQYLEHTFFK